MGACCGGLNKPHKSLPEKKVPKADASTPKSHDNELKGEVAAPTHAAPLTNAPANGDAALECQVETKLLSVGDGIQVNGTGPEQALQAPLTAVAVGSEAGVQQPQQAEDNDLKETEATAARLVTDAMQAAIEALSERQCDGEQSAPHSPCTEGAQNGHAPHSPGAAEEEALSNWMKEDTRNILVIDEAAPRIHEDHTEVASVVAPLAAEAPTEVGTDVLVMDNALEQFPPGPEGEAWAAGEVPARGFSDEEHAQVVADVCADIPTPVDGSVSHSENEELEQAKEPSDAGDVHTIDASAGVPNVHIAAANVESFDPSTEVSAQLMAEDFIEGDISYNIPVVPEAEQQEELQAEHVPQEQLPPPPPPSVDPHSAAEHPESASWELVDVPPPPPPETESATVDSTAQLVATAVEQPADLSETIIQENPETEVHENLMHTSPVLELVGEQAKQDRAAWWDEQRDAGKVPILEDVVAVARDQREEWWSTAGQSQDTEAAPGTAAQNTEAAPSTAAQDTEAAPGAAPSDNDVVPSSYSAPIESSGEVDAAQQSQWQTTAGVAVPHDGQLEGSGDGGSGEGGSGGDIASSTGGSAGSPDCPVVSSPESPQRPDAPEACSEGIPALEATVPTQA